jgi:endonuclease/exonuclease/phosphatase family metal-dependent hydrolase
MAAIRPKTIAKKIMIVITMLIALAFLLSCLIPYLNPARWWFVGFLGLAVPYLVTMLAFLLIFWLIVKPSVALVPFITLLIGFQQIRVTLAWHYNSKPAALATEHNLRVLTWNIRSFNTMSRSPEKKKHSAEDVASLILQQDADVVCLQEFNHTPNSQDTTADHMKLFSKKYPYHIFSRDFYRSNGYTSGSIIFSRYPLADSGRVKFPGNLAESLIYIDIVKDGDTARVFTTHLQSFRFNDSDYNDIEKVKQPDKEAIAASKSLFKKMKLAFTRRGIQAKIVREELDKAPYPVILCGDFNDVPNSFTYFHIRRNMQDAFLKKSFGVGRTYYSIAPTLRIDYILADPKFAVERFDMVDEGLSDHTMLVSDIKLKQSPAATN